MNIVLGLNLKIGKMKKLKNWWENRPYWQKGGIILIALTLISLFIFGLEGTLLNYTSLIIFFISIFVFSIILMPIYLLFLYIKKDKNKVRKF